MASTLTRVKYFDVAEEGCFSKRFDELRGDYECMEAIHEAVTTQLSRAPSSGQALERHPGHSVYKTYPVGETPSFWIVYRVDWSGEKVTLVSIAPAEVPSMEE